MPYKDKTKAKEMAAKRHREKYDPEKSRDYYLKNKEKVLQTSRKTHLRNAYDLSPEDYDYFVHLQKNQCAICHKTETRLLPSGKIKPLSVDHNHTTGKVRALLCNDCNASLGFCKEDKTLLLNMIAYLEKYDE
jgi:hypothetical protein